MSQLSFSSFDTSLMVRDAQGRYLLATADQILEAARQAIEQKMQRGASFSSPAAVKEYLRAKLADYEHEVFAVLFLDTQHRLIEYAEMFRGTIDSASVYPRELVKEALRLNAAAVNQIDKAYGQNHSILDNCHVRVTFATNDEHTAKRISETLGTATELRAQRNYAGHRLAPWLGQPESRPRPLRRAARAGVWRGGRCREVDPAHAGGVHGGGSGIQAHRA